VNWPGAKDFAARYLARFGKEPTYHAAVAYELMMIMRAGNEIVRVLGTGTASKLTAAEQD
jgi:hypothetical protein